MTQFLLLYVNAAICAAICVRLVFYRRGGAGYRPLMSWVAYGLAVCTGSVTLRTLLGAYALPIDPAELAINAILCMAVFAAGGNTTRLLSPPALSRLLGRWREDRRRKAMSARATTARS